MGRMSKKEKKELLELGLGQLSDGRWIIPEGTKIDCLKCNESYEIEKDFVGKRYYCTNCGNADRDKLRFDGNELELIRPIFSETDEEYEERKKEVSESSSPSVLFTRLDAQYFDDSDYKPVDKEIVEKVRGKDLRKFLSNISRRDLVHAFLERKGLEDEQQDTLIEVLNERKLLKRAKSYEEKFNELRAEIEEEPEGKPKRFWGKKIVRKPRDLEFEEEEAALLKKYEEASAKEKVIKGKIKEELKKEPKLKKLVDYFSVEGIAKAIVHIDVNFLNIWFPEEDYVDEEEQESLQYIWELAVDFYSEDFEKMMSYLSIILLVFMHLSIVGKRVKKYWFKPKPKEGEEARKKLEEKIKKIKKEEEIE